ncbi:MAG: hypothetical protein JWP81_1933 [Ferruginibacter sp.]|nr:hypothetical protein [Ferruginibacter sp.]
MVFKPACNFLKIGWLLCKLTVSYLRLCCTKRQAKACIVHAHFGKLGGTRTYFYSLIEYLSAKQFDITVLVSRDQCDEELLQFQSMVPFSMEQIDFEFNRTTFAGNIFNKNNRRHLLYQINELAFYFTHIKKCKANWCVLSEANPELLLFLFLSPVRLVYILHTVATDRLDSFKRWMLNRCLSPRKLLVTVSQFSRDTLLRNWTKGRHSGYIKVIHNFFEPRVSPVQAVKSTQKRVLTIGHVEAYKNPLFWISACKKVSSRYSHSVQFIWAGDGSLFKQCKAASSDTDNIHFIGYDKNVDQLYADCDVYFQPSILESHGIAVIGAMHYAKPCVVANSQGLPESVIDDVTGKLVSIQTEDEAVAAILHCLNNTAQANEWGGAGKRRFDAHFSKQVWQAKMDEVFS